MFSQLLQNLAQFSLGLVSSFGYRGIVLVSFLENVFTPIPSEAVMPFAGFLVTQGRFNLILVVIVATLGSVLGSLAFYYLGYFLGGKKVRDVILRWGKYFFIHEKDIDEAEKWLEKYGPAAVLICRVIPQVRSFISIPAGFVKMPLLKFISLTILGTMIWLSFLTGLGVFFGENYTRFLPYFQKVDLVFGLILLLVAFYLIFRKIRSYCNVKTK